MDIALKDAHDVALRASRRASEHLMNRFSEGSRNVLNDSRHDVKLEVDVEAEDMIKRTIKEAFCGHGFICEESGEEDTESVYKWVIDPLDGTVNFSRGIPHFCTSIALKRGEEYLLGVVCDPVRKETFSAMKGYGAFLNGRPLKKHSTDRLDNAVVSGGFFHEGSIERGIETFSLLVPRVKKVRFFGAAAIDLCYLSADRINGYINFSTNEWDIAAASLVVSLAGARVETKNRAGKFDIIAADSHIFDEFRAITRF